MSHNHKFTPCTPLLLSIMAGLPSVVNAEAFSHSVTSAQITKTVPSDAKSVTDLNSTAVQGSLTDTLVKKLGISSEQARGGAGALFQLAKGQLDAGQFAELSKTVPEMDGLLSAAPKQAEILGGSAEGASSPLGEANNPYGNLAGLASAFKLLNLSPDMADEFIPVVVDYVRAKGGALTANMLQSALYGGF